VWWPVGKVSGTESVGLPTVGVEDDDGWPPDPAALVRVPEIERLEGAAAARIAVDRERQEPARREGGVALGRVDRYRGEVSAEGVDLTQYVRQPNQLAAAVRSPVAAIGHQHQRPVDPANVSHVEHRRTISRHVGAAVATAAVPARQNPVEESAPAGASKMNTDDHELRTPRGRAVGSATLAGADWGDE